MPPIASQNTYCLGPDIAGMSPPDLVLAVFPDTEKTASQKQACQIFEGGTSDAVFLLTDATTGLAIFNKVSEELLSSQAEMQEDLSSAAIALWRLPTDEVGVLAADLDGNFARSAFHDALAVYPAGSLNHRVSEEGFNASLLCKDAGLSEALRSSLRFLSS
jgi:hypothetical protein